MKDTQKSIIVSLFFFFCSTMLLGQTDTVSSFKSSLTAGIAIPLTGSPNLLWERPISSKFVIGTELAYFDREWVFILEPSDWTSKSVFLGTFLKYYPSNPNMYEGYWVGIDGGLAIANQKYVPINKSEVFFYPYIDLYFGGYTFGLNKKKGWYLDVWTGCGWAPVAKEVNIDGYSHDTGDWYPIADIRIVKRFK